MKFKWLRVLYFLVFLFIFIQFIIISPSILETKDEEQILDERSQKTSLPEQTMGGVHLVESQKGERDWELFSKTAQGNQTEGNWTLQTVKVLFYSSENMSFTVTGNEGQIESTTKNLKLRGNVKTVSSNGYEFITDSASYMTSKRQILSPDFVKLKGPKDNMGEGMMLTGNYLIANVNENTMKIYKDIKGSKKLNDGKSFDIKSNSVEMKGNQKEIHFIGQVVINYSEMTIRGPFAKFLYSSGDTEMNRLIVEGGVVVDYQDKKATSEILDLDLATNKFVFKGKPKLIQNEDELTGDQIIFLDGGKRVKVEKLKAEMK